jgi:hypothetical protein
LGSISTCFFSKLLLLLLLLLLPHLDQELAICLAQGG